MRSPINRRVTVVAAIAAGGLSATGAARGAVAFNFDDGTFQGWTNVEDSGATLAFTPSNDTSGGRGTPSSGAFHVIPEPFGNRDGTHELLLARSPAFFLDGSGDLTLTIVGGQGAGMAQATLPTSPTDLAANTTPATPGVHAMGIAVRRVSDGAYVATAQKANHNDQHQAVTISDATLDAVNAANPGAQFTLDVYDSYEGGWGWIGFDTVSVPGTLVPEPGSLSLLALGGVLLVRRRRA